VVECFTNSNYTTGCAEPYPALFGAGDTLLSGKNTYTWTSLGAYSHTFYPSNYYRLTIIQSGGTMSAWGASTDVYTGTPGTPVNYYLNGTDVVLDAYFSFGTVPVTDFSTRIDTTTPVNKSTVATSTSFTIGATGYLNSGDLEDETTVSIHWHNTGAAVLQCADVICAAFGNDTTVVDHSIEEPLLSDGIWSVSTTTSITQIGRYEMTTSITNPRFTILGFSFGHSTLVSTTTTFIVATSTKADALIAHNIELANQLLTEELDNTDCSSWTDFATNMSTCIYGLFIPNTAQVKAVVDAYKENVFKKVPVGYVTRLVTILSTDATSTVPDLALELPGSLPVSGTTHLLRVGTAIASSSAILLSVETDDSNNIWDLAMPVINTIAYLALFLAIFHDVTGIRHKHNVKHT